MHTVHNIGVVVLAQGKFDDSLEWHRRALTGREKALGMEHPDTLYTVHGMASVFQRLRNYDESLEWYNRALSGMKGLYNEMHPAMIAVEKDARRLKRSRNILFKKLNS